MGRRATIETQQHQSFANVISNQFSTIRSYTVIGLPTVNQKADKTIRKPIAV